MLKINSKSMDFNGSSVIDEVVVASMHASYAGGRDMYINMNVSDIDAYLANKEIVDIDFAAFCGEIVEVLRIQHEELAVEEE